MRLTDLRFALAYVLAVAVPAATLHLSAPEERLAAGLTAPPFAWPRVLVAHLLTALPLGVLVARLIRSAPAVNEFAPGVWPVAGVAVTGAAVLVCPGIGEAVAEGGFDALPLLVLRALIALALVFPWCVWAADPPHPGTAVRSGWQFALGGAVALVPCGLYCEAAAEAGTERAADLVRRERVVRADAALAGLIELGSDRPVMGAAPATIRKGYAARLPQLAGSAARPLPANAPPSDRMARALVLIQLDRPAEAAGLLEGLGGPDDDTVTLLLATVYRDLERWTASDELYRRVLDKLRPQAASNPQAADMCATAIEGLAFNARADRRPADAEWALKMGLDVLPGRAAQFHLQLGRHYHDGGRHGPAREHLREAARLDPRTEPEVGKVLRQINTATPGCFSWQ
ncbi:hypothetical protein R5W24_002449 [Gemmata sp. JC717]|uniref:hypothetical protein n=1 Tax=Gemmata algarum TaxID=2975278 RepID=UPI0021BB15BD|nr:hypothetical protein [Gemmata algarum]MDY3553348.1 hypothetical protein [Gemmata algarum]